MPSNESIKDYNVYEQLGQEAYAPARRARNAWLKQNLFVEDDDATT